MTGTIKEELMKKKGNNFKGKYIVLEGMISEKNWQIK